MLVEEYIGTYCIECGECHDEAECPNCGCEDFEEETEYTCDICGFASSDPWVVCDNCGAPAYPTDPED